MLYDDNKVTNFPVVDNRVVEFTKKLEAFVCAESVQLPLIAVIGALETVKLVIFESSAD